MDETRAATYLTLAEQLEREAEATADERVRWQRETLARAYRLALRAARRDGSPTPE